MQVANRVKEPAGANPSHTAAQTGLQVLTEIKIAALLAAVSALTPGLHARLGMCPSARILPEAFSECQAHAKNTLP